MLECVCMFVCVCIHMCVCVEEFVYVCVDVCMYVSMYMWTQIHAYVYIHVYACMWMCLHVFICVHVYSRMCTCVCVFMCVFHEKDIVLLGSWLFPTTIFLSSYRNIFFKVTISSVPVSSLTWRFQSPTPFILQSQVKGKTGQKPDYGIQDSCLVLRPFVSRSSQLAMLP